MNLKQCHGGWRVFQAVLFHEKWAGPMYPCTITVLTPAFAGRAPLSIFPYLKSASLTQKACDHRELLFWVTRCGKIGFHQACASDNLCHRLLNTWLFQKLLFMSACYSGSWGLEWLYRPTVDIQMQPDCIHWPSVLNNLLFDTDGGFKMWFLNFLIYYYCSQEQFALLCWPYNSAHYHNTLKTTLGVY